MAWVLLVIAVGLTVAALVIVLGVRHSLIVLLGLVIASVVGVIWYAEFEDKRYAGAIPVEYVQLTNTSMVPGYGSSFQFAARVKNAADQHVLTVFSLTVIASDCPVGQSEPQCEIIGEQTKEIHVVVPPNQARDISEQFRFDGMRPKGELTWDYRVNYTRAQTQ